jgi:5-dehydro-2-deoxygluconokinase
MKQELFILPFDHRVSFLRDIPNVDKEKVKKFKNIIFEAFLLTIKKEKNRKSFGILVDEEYGKEVLKRAKKENITVCLPIEKSGKEELSLEYGKDFKKHVDKFKPDFVKVLIRYNPLNVKTNKNQLRVLKKINELSKKYKIILELLVPPSKGENIKKYDEEKRDDRTVEAISEIRKAIKVNIWKLEGFGKIQWNKVIKAAPQESKIIFLGRGQDKKKVTKWLKAAAPHEEIIGFAVGRTTFLEAIKKYNQKKISKKETIEEISSNFRKFINLWRKEKR